MSHTTEEKAKALCRVIEVLDTLRVKCPWDAKQTNQTLRANTVEEVFELCDALSREDNPEIKKELGDVLLHVLFYAKIGEEKEAFDIADVANALADKLIFRHPHVYGDTVAETSGKVEQNWEQIKLKEKDGNKSVLAGVPAALPALIKAYRIQQKAANAGFDWDEAHQVWDKVKEEIAEFEKEAKNYTDRKKSGELKVKLTPEERDKMEAEMGDVLFSLVNASRLYGIHPDNALERTNKKFIARFNYIEARAKELGRPLAEMTLAEMDALWDEAKHKD